jgi:eukaryotic-like serine/threonine-protein kinase
VRAPLLSQQTHLVPGYRLDDRYELLYPYAQGGMATVWAARIQGKHGFQKLVAVKTILPHYARDQSFRTMFLDEARIASRIRHPNVAEMDDLGEEDGTLYMVLEWVDGDSWSKLHAAIANRGQPVPVNLMLRIAADTCAGLHAAHELRGDDGALLNVVHRDVSPQNVLISTVGATKVIDFGVAKARDRLGEQTRTGLLKGKVEYTSPEQAMMKPSDRRSDIWAIGTILYQLFAGHLPFEGKTELEALRRLTSGKPPPALPPSVPGPVAAAIMRALHASPAGRFTTALDMQRALEAAITQPTTQTDVAACVNAYLADRIERRRTDMAEALAEANERAKTRAARGSRPDLGHASEPPPHRAPLPSFHENLPAEAWAPPVPLVPPAPPPPASLPSLASGRSADDWEIPTKQIPDKPLPSIRPPGLDHGAPPPGRRLTTEDTEVPTRMRAASLKTSHWLIMALAAFVTIGVWSLVGFVALRGKRVRPAAEDVLLPAPGAPAPSVRR